MWAGNAALLGQTESTAVWGPPAGSPVRSALGEGVGVGRLQQIFCGRLGRWFEAESAAGSASSPHTSVSRPHARLFRVFFFIKMDENLRASVFMDERLPEAGVSNDLFIFLFHAASLSRGASSPGSLVCGYLGLART